MKIHVSDEDKGGGVCRNATGRMGARRPIRKSSLANKRAPSHGGGAPAPPREGPV